MNELFFRPKSVAIIGASRDTRKLGYGVVRNLVDYRFKGHIYPINPVATDILELPCYPDIESAPESIDLAVVVLPASLVDKTLIACGKKGIKNVIITSGGFGETGEEGAKREKILLDIAKQYGIRIIGPNCIGTMDTHTPLNTTFITGMPQPGEIGFISQSGAMVAAVIDWALGAGVGFSRIVSFGNGIDINETDMIQPLINDKQTKVITAYVEGVTNGSAFMKAAYQAALQKPVIVMKGGRGESGAKAVASHTGALAGSATAYDAAFKRCGVIQASSTEELFDLARSFAWQPLPQGNRVAVLTNAGGPAILAVDAMEQLGLKLADISEQTQKFLKHRLPEAASVKNPVDVLAGSGPGTYSVALDTLLADENVDIAIVIQAPQDWFLPESLAEVIGEVAAIHKKTVMSAIMGMASVGSALEILHQKKIPNFSFPERIAPVLKAMIHRRQWLQANQSNPVDFDIISTPRSKPSDWKSILGDYHITLPKESLVQTLEDGLSQVKTMGYPVVLKLQSSKETHKADIGGLELNIREDEEFTSAFNRLLNVVKNRKLEDSFEGILIQQMVASPHEILVGMTRDPQFGPMIVVGTGGTEVELRKDIASDLAPLNADQANELLNQTIAGKRLDGWRSLPAGDKDSVIQTIVGFSQLVVDYPDIKEMDINPLMVLEKGAVAVDVRIIDGE